MDLIIRWFMSYNKNARSQNFVTLIQALLLTLPFHAYTCIVIQTTYLYQKKKPLKYCNKWVKLDLKVKQTLLVS